MDCYVCATEGIERDALALCRSCGAGLCMEHLRQTASYLATGAIRPACSHGIWNGPFAARGTHGRRLRGWTGQHATERVHPEAEASYAPPAA